MPARNTLFTMVAALLVFACCGPEQAPGAAPDIGTTPSPATPANDRPAMTDAPEQPAPPAPAANATATSVDAITSGSM